jgi:hypothetical protein
MGKLITEYKISMRKPEEKRSFGRLSHTQNENTVKLPFKVSFWNS